MHVAQGLATQTPGAQLQVTLATDTPRGDWSDASLPFRVVRQPGIASLWSLIGQADVIHLAGPNLPSMLLGWLRRKPVVVEHSGYHACCPSGRLMYIPSLKVCPGHFLAHRYRDCFRCNAMVPVLGRLRSLRMLLETFPRRWLASRAARNVGPSDHIGRRIALPRTVTIRHGVPLPPTVTLSTTTVTPICFGHVGRLVWEKGGHVLLAAAHELRHRGFDFRLKIIGDGPYRARLEALTDGYGLRDRTTFTGYLQGDALQVALQGVAATVMPSICEDVAPVAAIESMARARLVIASDTGGLTEIVEGVGLTFPLGDAKALAGCMQRVLDEPALATVLGGKAHERAASLYREDRMVAEHLSLYREVATARKSPAPALERGD